MKRRRRSTLSNITTIVLTAAIVGAIVYFVQESRYADTKSTTNEASQEETNQNINEATNDGDTMNVNEEETHANENINEDEENENVNAQEDDEETTSDTVNIYAVKLEDNGAAGDLVGCGDSVVPVATDIEVSDDTAATIEAALTELFATDDEYIEDEKFYNALYQSQLRVESVVLENGVAKVQLYGKYQLGGTCDNPRFEEQIESTITQFSDVESTEVMLNDETLAEAMSLKGEDENEEEEE